MSQFRRDQIVVGADNIADALEEAVVGGLFHVPVHGVDSEA